MNSSAINAFFSWAYTSRAQAVARMCDGDFPSREDMFFHFLSHMPVMATHGPAGLNACVKGVGFIPQDAYIEETCAAYQKHIATYAADDPTYQSRGLNLLMRYLYSDDAAMRIDRNTLVLVEMAHAHTWENVRNTPDATLLFYVPPSGAYEVRGHISIHEDDIYHTFANAQHDVYHTPTISAWETRPAYLFSIEEVYPTDLTGRSISATE